jgi:hypothetical protein
MSLSTQQIASSLPHLRGLIKEWESKNTPLSTRPDNAPARDVIIAFRTRPILSDEGARFIPIEDTSSVSENNIDPDAYLCAAISVRSVEPGITVAHAPSQKVIVRVTCSSLILLIISLSGMACPWLASPLILI